MLGLVIELIDSFFAGARKTIIDKAYIKMRKFNL